MIPAHWKTPWSVHIICGIFCVICRFLVIFARKEALNAGDTGLLLLMYFLADYGVANVIHTHLFKPLHLFKPHEPK